MPYPGIPKSMTGKMESCVTDVMGQGHDKSSAIAICNDSLMKHKDFIINKEFVLVEGLLLDMHKEDGVGVFLKEEPDGRYQITAISTAALKDRVGETFDTGAMDYEIKEFEAGRIAPDFTVFHKRLLSIGKIEKMSRAGAFAVEQGHSYTDPFSLAVCKDMLSNNADGKWKVSRGFYVLEASGTCPVCHKELVINAAKMAIFKCPVCKSIHLGYKPTLKEIHFRKTKTFEITVTDIPCVPYTGVSALLEHTKNHLEDNMTKKELKERLLKAGLDETVVDAKLATLTDVQLKEMDDIPYAELKELVDAAEPVAPDIEGDGAAEQTFVLDEGVLQAFAAIARKEVEAALAGFTIDIPSDSMLKEAPEILAIQQQLAEIKEMLTRTDEQRTKELASGMPRSAGLRVMRLKMAPKSDAVDDEEDAADQGDEDEEAEGEQPSWLKKAAKKERIMSSDGTTASTLTELVMGKR